ncbi:MAG: hypothetical protein JXA82_06615 [Sedimentisphaerales bacterium]|nr:hypothetical protein [Sedimentisphaerales bacterium]
MTSVMISAISFWLSVLPVQSKSSAVESQRFEQIACAQKGQITVHPQYPAWLMRKGGKPLFMCGPGDPEDFLYRGALNPDGTRTGDQMQIIQKLKGTGANCIYIQAIRSHGGDGDRTHNPFKNHDPNKRINSNVLNQWETWFTVMDESGIVIFLFLYDDSANVWKTGDQVKTPEKQFIHTLVDRFEHHKNLIWCIAEEYAEALSTERVKRIAAEIRNADDHDHVIAVHKNHGLDFSEFAEDPNIDQFAVQYNIPTIGDLHGGLVEAWDNARGRYNLNMSECADHGTGIEMRRRNWACAMAGAYVMILRMDIVTTDIQDLYDCGMLVRFFEETNFVCMRPEDELAYEDTTYILAGPDCYILYSSNCMARLGLKNLPLGNYHLIWLDCENGRRISKDYQHKQRDKKAWPKPENFGPEVALSIQKDNSL